MPQLEFMDCPRCGKRVAKSAKSCHHCERLRRNSASSAEMDDEESESHHTASFGGYDTEHDDFDYEEFLSEEFPETQQRMLDRNRWKYVSILLLIVIGFLMLIPFLRA